MITIGLTGGVASGKSLVAKFFAELGAVVLDADRAGHAALREPQVRESLLGRWGTDILAPDGEIDRPAVARRVFGDGPELAAERRFLEGLLHPRIRSRLEAERTRSAKSGGKVFVFDAALLQESNWASVCDEVVFVDAPRDQRQARAAARGWSEEQFAQREAAQWPIERKRQHANWVLSNAGSPEDLRAQVRELWRSRIEPRISAPT